jgi:predicted NACHT family NTPase
MSPADILALTGLKDAVSKCFASVFSEITGTAEAWLSVARLQTTCRQNYADYVARAVGTFPLFATGRSATIEACYVQVAVSSEIEREKYKPIKQIERLLRQQKIGYSLQSTSAPLSPLAAIESTATGFALVGNPGSGKTTAFRYISMEAARGTLVRKMRRLPVYLPVRDLALRGTARPEAPHPCLNG